MTPEAPTHRRAVRGASYLDGILLIDKPRGASSAAAVARVKRALGGPKIGHLGTLDPFASGLLPMCLGEGTKLAPYVGIADKTYEGVARLGVCTDTLDFTGAVVATAAVPRVSDADLSAIAHDLTGQIAQVPPAFSALKRGGKRMYELARKGEAPALEPRPVTVYELRLALVDAERVHLTVRCSKGTYVRALARDVGERLGCGASLESLVRTAFGGFQLAAALDLDAVDPARAAAALVSLEESLAHLRTIRVEAATAAQVRAGRQAALSALEAPLAAGEKARLLGPAGGLVAVIGEHEGAWKVERAFRVATSCAPPRPVLEAPE